MPLTKTLLQFCIWFSVFLFPVLSFADEGMWLPMLLKQLNEADMQSKGFKMTAEDIYSTNKSSMKDAVVLFGRGCTGELVSNQSLLITNHHCGFSQIQYHSTLANNYLRDGFWAMKKEEELPNPGLTVTFIIRMDDVTEQVLEGVSPDWPEEKRESLVQANIKKINAFAVNGSHFGAITKPFFYGTVYYQFITETFLDVRLVGAPPSGIGKFGGDTDNWVWPRHTGDFSLFRIYAGKDNKPAPYSKDNVPFTPRHFFPVSLKGIQPGDFTMVYGFPGRTQEYLPSYALENVLQKFNPVKISLRRARLDIIDKTMTQSEMLRIKYADKQSDIANYWKKWAGESKGLVKSDAIAKKRKIEADFMNWLKQSPDRNKKYGTLLNDLKLAHENLANVTLPFEYYREAVLGAEILIPGLYLDNLKAALASGKEIEKAKQNCVLQFKAFFKDYDEATGNQLFDLCIKRYMEDLPKQSQAPELADQLVKFNNNTSDWRMALRKKSKLSWTLADTAFVIALQKTKDTSKIIKEPLYQTMSMFSKQYNGVNLPAYFSALQKADQLHRLFFTGLKEMQTDKVFYPDANLTLRVAYGKVGGYQPDDAIYYKHFTTIEGIMQKDNPKVEEFNVPEKLRQLYKSKDYGQYAVNGTLPVAFIASNHTTGGNSGSPVIDGEGNLIGTNFDRVWEGTMSDYNFDASICRNIACDARYMLFIIDKFAGAGHLVSEMKLVK